MTQKKPRVSEVFSTKSVLRTSEIALRAVSKANRISLLRRSNFTFRVSGKYHSEQSEEYHSPLPSPFGLKINRKKIVLNYSHYFAKIQLRQANRELMRRCGRTDEKENNRLRVFDPDRSHYYSDCYTGGKNQP